MGEYIHDCLSEHNIIKKGWTVDIASENIVYYCLNCNSFFGCNNDDNEECWCSECHSYKTCDLRTSEHRHGDMSHGICRTCFNEISSYRKPKKQAVHYTP